MSHKYSHLIWLGANTATEPANLLSCAQQVTLFEARETASLALQKKYPEPHISVINALVTATNQTVNFTEYNLADFSATQPATGLVKFFPGLKALKSEPQNGIAIGDAINKLALGDDNNLLVVDIPDSSLALLKALEASKQLSHFSAIYVHTAHEPLYADAASQENIIVFMQSQGYLPQEAASNDPDLPWLSFIINPLWITLQQTQQKNRVLEAEQAKLNAQLNAAQEEFLGNQKAFDQKNIESTKQLQSLEQQIADQKQQLVSTSKQKQEAEEQLATVKQQLSTAQQELAKSQQQKSETTFLSEIEENIQKIFSDQLQKLTKEMENIKTQINNSQTNSTRQLESYIGIQNYLTTATPPLNFHDWAISPDIGLYLIELIDTNNFDAIIEFGSGTSTTLMAKALNAKQLKMKATNNSNNLADTENHTKITAFEHKAEIHERNLNSIKSHGVEKFVDLIHSPLVDYQYKDGNQFLYYNCNEKLEDIAKTLKGKKAHILVLVDGPPGFTNKNARFPALPHILNKLPEHSFTIIMDDYNRQDEKETAAIWEKVCKALSRPFTKKEVHCEKGLLELST